MRKRESERERERERASFLANAQLHKLLTNYMHRIESVNQVCKFCLKAHKKLFGNTEHRRGLPVLRMV